MFIHVWFYFKFSASPLWKDKKGECKCICVICYKKAFKCLNNYKGKNICQITQGLI